LPSPFPHSFAPFDHLKQTRRSYFKQPRRDDFGTQSQVSTSGPGLGLADQPLAEMTNQNVASNSNTGHSLTNTPSLNDRSRATSPIPPPMHEQQNPNQKEVMDGNQPYSTPNGNAHRNEYVSESERRGYSSSQASGYAQGQQGYPPQRNGYTENEAYQMEEKTGYAT